MTQLHRLLLGVVLLALPIISISGTSNKKDVEPDVFGTVSDYSLNNLVQHAKKQSDDNRAVKPIITATVTKDSKGSKAGREKQMNSSSVASHNLTGKWFGTFTSGDSGTGYGFEATLSSSGNHFKGKIIDQTNGNPEGLINSGVVSEEGNVSFSKQYMDTDVSQVQYTGHLKSDGSIVGTWHVMAVSKSSTDQTNTKPESGTFNMSRDQ